MSELKALCPVAEEGDVVAGEVKGGSRCREVGCLVVLSGKREGKFAAQEALLTFWHPVLSSAMSRASLSRRRTKRRSILLYLDAMVTMSKFVAIS